MFKENGVLKPVLRVHSELLRAVAPATAKFAPYVKFPAILSRIGEFGIAPTPKAAAEMKFWLSHYDLRTL